MIWYAQNSSVNIDSLNEWNDAPDGSGNWLTWGNLAAGDILAANGKTAIAINVSFTCLRISTAAEGGTAGGGFTVSGAVTITANILAGTTDGVTTSGTGYTLTVVGNVTGGSGTSKYGINNVTAVTINITGNVSGGTGVSSYGLNNNSTGTINVTGNVAGGSNTTALGIYNNTTGVVTITGTVSGGSGVRAYGVHQSSTGVTTVNSGNLINSATAMAVTGAIIYNPGAQNYIQYPKPTSGHHNYAQAVAAGSVIEGVFAGVDDSDAVVMGTYHEATAAEVQSGVTFGPSSGYTGTYSGGGGGPLIGEGNLVS